MDYFKVFKEKLNEEETVVTQESDKDKILRKSKKVVSVLTKLISSQKAPNEKAMKEIQNLVSDIKVISYKPTTFRIVLANNSFFDLKYDPSPMELKYKDEFQDSDSFVVKVSGKNYYIVNRADFQQCLDALNKIMRENPIGAPDPAAEEQPEESTEDETWEKTDSKEEEKPKDDQKDEK